MRYLLIILFLISCSDDPLTEVKQPILNIQTTGTNYRLTVTVDGIQQFNSILTEARSIDFGANDGDQLQATVLSLDNSDSSLKIIVRGTTIYDQAGTQLDYNGTVLRSF